jgi:hypothetical protein
MPRVLYAFFCQGIPVAAKIGIFGNVHLINQFPYERRNAKDS